MNFTPGIALFIFCAQFLAYTVKGLIGFGNPLISAPILSMRLDNVVITPGTLLLDCPVNGYIIWKNRRSFQWRKILPLLLANLCGVIPGTLLLRFSLPWVIKTVLGVVVVFLGLEMATRNLRPVRAGKDRAWLRLVVSFFSGMCSGLFGINMFIVAYLQLRRQRPADTGCAPVRRRLRTGGGSCHAAGRKAGSPAGRGEAPESRHCAVPAGRRQHHCQIPAASHLI